jgi:DNA-binding transcriptional LysR family regulator
MIVQMIDVSHLDLTSMRRFVVLMEDRSVSRAANRLNLSHPTLSHSLAKLRKVFDDPLLVRSRSGMVPTTRALELHRTIRKILAEIERQFLESELFDPKTARTRFIVSATEYFEYVLMPDLLKHMQQKAPGISIEVHTPRRDLVHPWLEAGETDFRLGWMYNPPGTLHSRLLFRDQLVCLARKGHPRVRGKLTINDYVELPHVRSLVTGQTISRAVAVVRKDLRVQLVVQNFLAIPYGVACSDMIATVPERLARGFAHQLRLQVLPLPFETPPLQFYVHWHDRTHRDPRHRWFRQALVKITENY